MSRALATRVVDAGRPADDRRHRSGTRRGWPRLDRARPGARARSGSAADTAAGDEPDRRPRSTWSCGGCPATSRLAGFASTSPDRTGPAAGERRRTSIASGSRPAGESSARSGRSGRRGAGEPDRTETRLLAAAADQVGQALPQDRLGGRGPGRGDRPPERRPEVRPAPVGVARPANAAGHDPGRRRDAAAGQPAQRRGPRRERRGDRPRGRVPQPAGDEPARPVAGSRPARSAPRRDVFELDDLVGRTLERLRTRLGGSSARGRARRRRPSASTRSSSTRP